MGKKQSSSSSSSSKPKADPVIEEPIKPTRNLNRIKNVKTGNAGNSKDAIPLNSTAARAAKAVEEGRPPPLFPVGYKTPLNLLTERCAKNGWQKPDLQTIKLPSGGYTCIIRLSRQDPKTGLETITFRPSSSVVDSPNTALDKPSATEAKQWGSIYALHRFCSNLQMSMVLPPVCRDYWSALQNDKKEQLASSKGNKEVLAMKWSEDPFEAEKIRKSRLEAFKANSISSASSAVAAGGASEGGNASSSGAPSANNSGRNTPSGGFGLPKDTPEIKMSIELRRMVQETIRKMREIKPPGPPPSIIDDTSSSSSNTARPSSSSSSAAPAGLLPEAIEPFTLTKEEKTNATRDLQVLGYRKGHIEAGLQYFQTLNARYDPLLEGLTTQTLQETLLQYLQITLSEEELPGHGSTSSGQNQQQHNPHGASSEPNVRIAKQHHHKEKGLARSWLVDKIVKNTGYPEDVVEDAVEITNGDEGKSILLLQRRLVGWLPAYFGSGDDDSEQSTELGGQRGISEEEMVEVKDKMETEVEALESMLGSAVQRKGKDRLEIQIKPSSSSSSSKPKSSSAPLLLEILMHPSSRYPSPSAANQVFPSEDSEDPDSAPRLCVPTFYLTNREHVNGNTSIPPYIRLYLTKIIMEKMSTEWLDIIETGEGGVIYEMVIFLQDNLDEIMNHPPPAQEVFRFLRPQADDIGALASGTRNMKIEKGKHVKRDGGGHPLPAGDSKTLLQQFDSLKQTSSYQTLLRKRQTLPAFSSRSALIQLIQDNRVVIVSGATGSGKTTQVPTFVLENAIESLKGKEINIIVTQPRRISAIGVATRVAAERCEDLVGKEGTMVGYAIRGERKASRHCRLLFCTTGILLQRLSRGGDPNLDNVSHVFVDEVHERSLDSDFLLLILKEVLAKNKKIKIVLMSATADSDRFSSYFNNAPCIEIPGQTFPVEDLYLEDVIRSTSYAAPSIKASRKWSNEENEAIRTSLQSQGIESPELLSTLGMLIRAEKIDFDLIAATVRYIHEEQSPNDMNEAILVFVTGVAEITATIRAIERLPQSRNMSILPLHANLTNIEQAKIFKPAIGGKRKVIVSTNVAETSITVDDVVHVIDTGRVKETRFDAISGVQRLIEDWNSVAGSRQRRGRAGRTKSGKCWRLYSRYQEENVMPVHTKPEILRTPLASLVLQVKALRGKTDVKQFLGNALDAPDVLAIQEALDTLLSLGAIEESSKTASATSSTTAVAHTKSAAKTNGATSSSSAGATGSRIAPVTSSSPASDESASTASLTPLGQNLALLPLDLRLGKMLILSSIFNVLEPMLYICASLSTKPLFSATSPELRDQVTIAKKKFKIGKSDLLTDLNAMSGLLAVSDGGASDYYTLAGAGAAGGGSKTARIRNFCEENCISQSAWREILSLRSDFVSALKSAGFTVPPSSSSSGNPSKSKVLYREDDENLLKAIIYAGTGKAVRIKLPQVKYEATIGGTAAIDHEAKEVKFYDNLGDEGRVFIHPSSILFSESKLKNGYLTYFNKAVTSKPFLRDATELPLYALLLFGRKLTSDPLKGGLSIENGKIRLRAPPRISVLINELRRLLDVELMDLIDDPGLLIQDQRSPVIESMMTLLRRNGS